MSIDIIARGLAAAQARSANTSALVKAVRNNAFFPQPAFRCPTGDVATITVPAANAVSVINAGAATAANVPVTNTAKITWLCGTADKDVNVTYSARGGWYAGGRANNYTSYEFQHTGTQLEVQILCSAVSPGTSNFRVLVNDRVAGTASVPNDGGNRLVRVVFPSSATRRVRIELAGGRHRGLNLASVNEVVNTGRNYPLVTLIGDSFPEGTGANPYDGEGISTLRAIGCNPASAGVGATGILNPGSGGKVNWQDANRLADLALNGWTDQITNAPVTPAMGVIMMSLNDIGLGSTLWNGAATLQEAVTKGVWTMVDHWQAQRPGKPLVVFGPTWTSESPILDIFRLRDAGQEACHGAGPNVWFLDRLGPGTRLRRGTRSVTATTGATTLASKIITGLGSTANLTIYSAISGAGIPAGARVMTIDSATQVTIDINCTATAAGVAITFQNDQTAIYTDTDGVHPNQAGHNLDSLWMARELRSLILSELS